jgi:hypothetical protein
MTVQQQHGRPVASVAQAQDDLAHVEVVEREIVEHPRVGFPARARFNARGAR